MNLLRKKLLLAIAIIASLNLGAKVLEFNKEGKFKILQLTDIHWHSGTDRVANTKKTITHLLKNADYDLIVLTGDNVVSKVQEQGWNELGEILEASNIPWAVTMGNHDHESDWSNEEIVRNLKKFKNCLTTAGSKQVHGEGNFILPIMSSKDKSVAEVLYFFDSNAYAEFGGYDFIKTDQIAWYENMSHYFTSLNDGYPLPSLAFFHIPLPEYKDLAASKKFVGNKNERVCSSDLNSGMFLKMVQQKEIMGCFVGHDHVNDYIGTYFGIALAYGRKTGFNSYGNLEKGGRVIELTEGERAFKTHVVTPTKTELNYNFPEGNYYKGSGYFPSKKYSGLKNGVKASYYKGSFESLDELEKEKSDDEFELKNFTIDKATTEKDYAFKYETIMNFDKKAIYKFRLDSERGAKLFIDDQLVVNYGITNKEGSKEGYIALEKGFHDIRLEYIQKKANKKIKLNYSRYKLDQTEVKESDLFIK